MNKEECPFNGILEASNAMVYYRNEFFYINNVSVSVFNKSEFCFNELL